MALDLDKRVRRVALLEIARAALDEVSTELTKESKTTSDSEAYRRSENAAESLKLLGAVLDSEIGALRTTVRLVNVASFVVAEKGGE